MPPQAYLSKGNALTPVRRWLPDPNPDNDFPIHSRSGAAWRLRGMRVSLQISIESGSVRFGRRQFPVLAERRRSSNTFAGL